MGWKYEVFAWTQVAGGPYRDVEVYQGASLVRAVLAMRRAKRTSGCVRLEWRG